MLIGSGRYVVDFKFIYLVSGVGKDGRFFIIISLGWVSKIFKISLRNIV